MKEPNLIIENLKAILEECTASEDAVSYVNSEDAGTLKAAIEALEKQEQYRWIPVTERLPENKKKVLVSYDTEDGKKVDISVFDKYGCLLGLVSAWRPLPEPYTEEEV